MTTAVAAAPTEDVHNAHHEHPSWLAHHFDDAEQQFDAGKMGMWLFLVTEVLFFSGMFCAYALYRNRNPEVFEFCSTFLNEKLGAINTGVLLFSSLTMAWAVRASQLKETKTLIGMLGATLGCAAIFLGVKAVEYSHKWALGLFPGKFYVSQIEGAPHSDVPYLWYLCILPLVMLVCFVLYYVYGIVTASKFHLRVAGPLSIAALCYFGGVGLGLLLESGQGHGDAHAAASHGNHGLDHAADHSQGEATPKLNLLPVDDTPLNDVAITPAETNTPDSSVNQKGMAGLFFSIYYCMTGVHAFHILGGMGVLTWLIVKSAREEFHAKYYGPVDNVGLYWHLVDFIWIYLFPLLYLIT
ncbi:MAG TPA: cytochrome c oxidase subunit 3 [Pirellula sp.]|nr:cytochrome c oxidase subunit 3 [Pirellula sp.]